MARSHYDNLRVTRNASDAVIRAAYRALVNQYHPDKFTGSPAEATRITVILNEAYAVLTDPARRRAHDAWLDAEAQRQAGSAGSSQGPAIAPAVPSNEPKKAQPDVVVRPRRRHAVYGLGFGIAVLVGSALAWLGPAAASGLRDAAGSLVLQWLGPPFGLWMTVVYGQWASANVLFVVCQDGVRFARGGGQLVGWEAIEGVRLDGAAMVFQMRTPVRATVRYPGWLLGMPGAEVLKAIQARRAGWSPGA